ncbi:hypothetical protein CJ010_09655 [Azoarcus sp. DD4]|uniref:DUF4124 domain-containing protein n=1 Tax=Azoarcus sp. DD4 TaxID=2027405 RepID=UPI00112EA9F1|nr:DUF4124 domain-containing protein [Azoarcus sp. DD4]QDF96774.1 hypothetical protein CJ010_09655 [Azoarcus sp. DD4]
MIRRATLTIAALSLLTALPVGAEIYSWRDKDGKIHYSDQAPPSGDVKVLRGGVQRPSSRNAAPAEGATEGAAQEQGQTQAKPAATETKPKTAADQEQAFRQRRAEAAEAQAKADKENKNSAERERNCQEARNQLAALQSGQRMARFGEGGERVVMDDAMRSEETARTQRLVDDLCR